MVITMAKLRMAHASTHGARKPPGPKLMNKSFDQMLFTKYLDHNLFRAKMFWPEIYVILLKKSTSNFQLSWHYSCSSQPNPTGKVSKHNLQSSQEAEIWQATLLLTHLKIWETKKNLNPTPHAKNKLGPILSLSFKFDRNLT